MEKRISVPNRPGESGAQGDRHPFVPPSPGPRRDGAAPGAAEPLCPLCPRPPAGTDLRQARSGLRDPMDTPSPPASVRTARDLHLKGKGTSSGLLRTAAARGIPGRDPGISSGISIPQDRERPRSPRVVPATPSRPRALPRVPSGVTAAPQDPSPLEGAGKGLQPWRRAGIKQVPYPASSSPSAAAPVNPGFLTDLGHFGTDGAQGTSREGRGGFDTPRAGGCSTPGWEMPGHAGDPQISSLSRDIPSTAAKRPWQPPPKGGAELR